MLGRLVIAPAGHHVGQVLLIDPAGWVVVRVAIADAVTQPFGGLAGGVAQRWRHLADQPASHVPERCADAQVGPVGLGRLGQVDDHLGQVDPGLGQPDQLDRLGAGGGDTSAIGSASPMSSEAEITKRRAMKRGSSPASSMRASQYRPASGSDPRIDLMNADATS